MRSYTIVVKRGKYTFADIVSTHVVVKPVLADPTVGLAAGRAVDVQTVLPCPHKLGLGVVLLSAHKEPALCQSDPRKLAFFLACAQLSP